MLISHPNDKYQAWVEDINLVEASGGKCEY